MKWFISFSPPSTISRVAVERALHIGNQATNGDTLMGLYGKMGSRPVDVDLAHLWHQLGVGVDGETTVLDGSAPWAAIRTSICPSIKMRE